MIQMNSPLLVEEVCMHLREMLDSGTIHPSQSAWCNAVVLVWKKDRGLHFCIDFHCLNTHMKKHSYPLPRIQEALESLVGAGHFSCQDLKSGFWQIKMDESLKQYTVFTIGNLGFVECKHVPFGLCNAPAIFRWLNLIYCLIYLDDIVIFLQTTEEHLHHLCIILTNLESTIWNWSHQSATSLERKSPIWHIGSQRMGCNPVTQIWKQLQSVHCLKLTLRCMPFLGWWATTEGSSRGLHTLHSNSATIWLEKGPAGSWSRCYFQRMPWRLSKHWNRCVWWLLFWLSLITLNHSCWRLMCPRRGWGQCYHRSKQMGNTTLSPMAAGPLHLTRRTITELSSNS